MIDICTVVFEQEIPILRLQAQSVGLHCQNIGVRNIYVVLNDAETLAESIDPAWWGPMASNVLVVPRSSFSAPWVENGWLSQQLWKMLCATMSYNFYTMILDAKTIVAMPMDLKRLCDDRGRLRVGRIPIQPVFETSRNIACELFGIEMDEQIGPGGVPYFFHNDSVRFMISDITIKTGKNFPEWFQQQGMLTEYILYSAYVKYKYHTHEIFYHPDPVIRTINLCHSQVSQAAEMLSEMKASDAEFVGVHRNAWSQLTAEQKNQYRLLLIDKGITAAWDMD